MGRFYQLQEEVVLLSITKKRSNEADHYLRLCFLERKLLKAHIDWPESAFKSLHFRPLLCPSCSGDKNV